MREKCFTEIAGELREFLRSDLERESWISIDILGGTA